MLQNVRDSMKGTLVAAIIFLFFVVPLVLTGVGDGSFLGSAAGTDAARVDGKVISKQELLRTVNNRKNQLLKQEGVDATSDMLKEENLIGPVLQSLTERAALQVSSEKGGMAIADSLIEKEISQMDGFKVDGKFDVQNYRRILSQAGYTPATFKSALRSDFLSKMHARGIAQSTFTTSAEADVLAALIQQKRSFFTIEIPTDPIKASVVVEEMEIDAYYAENSDMFREAEKISVQYVDLSVDGLAKIIDISPADVEAQYQLEVESFAGDAQYEIAHLLIESGDDSTEIATVVSDKIQGGDNFAELVKAYSEDSGSKENGGILGVMTPGIFPKAFEDAVYSLEQDEVSGPIETDAGIHFVKVLSKTVKAVPSLEARKAEILSLLQRGEAEQKFVEYAERLSEMTFSSPDLSEAAAELGLKVKTSTSFSRDEGSGIANNEKVRELAFSSEVLGQGYNSRVLEISDTQAFVLRKATHAPERVKSLVEVRESVVDTLTALKLEQKLVEVTSALIAKLKAGDSAKVIADISAYTYAAFDKVKRASAGADFQVTSKVFSMDLSQGAAFEPVTGRGGSHYVVGLTEVIAGLKSDMTEMQMQSLLAQLKAQSAEFEIASYEKQVIDNAKIKIY
ncbi:MAG: peptidyl-prolyl cis-trans isomerase D [Lentisphaeria bacterium]|jgi:peptidyl-prolyl cis-trans isomerase D